jgi:hypothetical protein
VRKIWRPARPLSLGSPLPRPRRTVGCPTLFYSATALRDARQGRERGEGLIVSPRARTWSFSTSKLAPRERAAAVLVLREKGIMPLEPLADRIPHVDILKWGMEGAGILLATHPSYPPGDGMKLRRRSRRSHPNYRALLDGGEAWMRRGPASD